MSSARALRTWSPLLGLLALTLIASPGCASEEQPGSVEPAAPGSMLTAQLGESRASMGTHAVRRTPPARHHRGPRRVDPRGSTDPAPAPAPASSQDPFADAFVAAHNAQRAAVSPAASPGLPPVRWSDELAAGAQAWAERCEFEHSRGPHGENLAARTNMAKPEDIVSSWGSEGRDFDYANNRCAAGEVCGHYTQIVWRDSTQIGCGVARCGAGGPFGGSEWFVWVCNYSPAGNWSGERPY